MRRTAALAILVGFALVCAGAFIWGMVVAWQHDTATGLTYTLTPVVIVGGAALLYWASENVGRR